MKKQEDGWEVGWCMKNKIGEKRTEVVNSLAPALFWCVHCRQWMSFWENPDSWRERIKWATFSIPLYTGPLPWFHKAYTFLTPKVDLNKKHHLAHCYTWACIHFHIQINWATFSAGACAYISVGKELLYITPRAENIPYASQSKTAGYKWWLIIIWLENLHSFGSWEEEVRFLCIWQYQLQVNSWETDG